jgi:hypothetical protein
VVGCQDLLFFSRGKQGGWREKRSFNVGKVGSRKKIEVEVGASQKAGLQGPWLPNEMINST